MFPRDRKCGGERSLAIFDFSVGGLSTARTLLGQHPKGEFQFWNAIKFEGSDDKDNEGFALHGKEGREKESLRVDNEGIKDEDGEDVDRKRSKYGGMSGKHTADQEISRPHTMKGNVENTTATKGIPESDKSANL